MALHKVTKSLVLVVGCLSVSTLVGVYVGSNVSSRSETIVNEDDTSNSTIDLENVDVLVSNDIVTSDGVNLTEMGITEKKYNEIIDALNGYGFNIINSEGKVDLDITLAEMDSSSARSRYIEVNLANGVKIALTNDYKLKDIRYDYSSETQIMDNEIELVLNIIDVVNNVVKEQDTEGFKRTVVDRDKVSELIYSGYEYDYFNNLGKSILHLSLYPRSFYVNYESDDTLVSHSDSVIEMYLGYVPDDDGNDNLDFLESHRLQIGDITDNKLKAYKLGMENFTDTELHGTNPIYSKMLTFDEDGNYSDYFIQFFDYPYGETDLFDLMYNDIVAMYPDIDSKEVFIDTVSSLHDNPQEFVDISNENYSITVSKSERQMPSYDILINRK